MHKMLALAFDTAKRSPDPSTKVGAVIARMGRQIGVGWNQFSPGIPEDWWRDRERKYRAVVHAEEVALLSAGPYTAFSIMYVTHHPCPHCAKLIAWSKVYRVVCPSGPWRDDPEIAESCRQAREILDLAGVEVVHHTNGVLD